MSARESVKIFPLKELIVLLGFLSLALNINAQTGEIAGKITDQNGQAVPFAVINTVDSTANKTGNSIKADRDGNYIIKSLAPGKYNLQYTGTGYLQQMQKGILVSADKVTFIDIRLKPNPNYQAGSKSKRKKK